MCWNCALTAQIQGPFYEEYPPEYGQYAGWYYFYFWVEAIDLMRSHTLQIPNGGCADKAAVDSNLKIVKIPYI